LLLGSELANILVALPFICANVIFLQQETFFVTATTCETTHMLSYASRCCHCATPFGKSTRRGFYTKFAPNKGKTCASKSNYSRVRPSCCATMRENIVC